jgi:hypothetical protein
MCKDGTAYCLLQRALADVLSPESLRILIFHLKLGRTECATGGKRTELEPGKIIIRLWLEPVRVP